jgi:hypothetical protein
VSVVITPSPKVSKIAKLGRKKDQPVDAAPD